MNQEIKKLWIDGLRSGKYRQGQGALKTPYGEYCCLGVLCDIYREVTGFGEWVDGAYQSFNESNSISLSPDVVKWAGLKESNPIFGGHDAIGLNDKEQYTFEQIANEIEKYL